MIDEPTAPALAALRELQAQVKRADDAARSRAALERSRRAALTPAGRAAEDLAQARATISTAAAGYQQYESFTLVEFACLLHAQAPPQERPAMPSAWQCPGRPAVVRTLCTLISATRSTVADVPGTLYPLNPAAAEGEWRFHKSELLRLARTKRLGAPSLLGEVIGDCTGPSLDQAMTAVKAALIGLAPVATVVAMGWHSDVREFMDKLRGALDAYAKATGQTVDAARAQLLQESTMKALHAAWIEDSEGCQQARQTFALFVAREYPEFKFRKGRRAGDSAREFLLRVLQAGRHGKLSET